MFKKTLTVALSGLLLTGCSALEYSETGETAAIVEGNLKRFGQTSMKVPSYYSTSQVDTKFKVGQKYYVQDLRCENSVNKCAN